MNKTINLSQILDVSLKFKNCVINETAIHQKIKSKNASATAYKTTTFV